MTYMADHGDSVNGRPNLVFGEAGPRLRRAGFAVMPADGKHPRMAGFNRWKHAPGPAVVEKWAQSNPDADVVYVPGLSRARRGGDSIIVVDGDDAEACARIVETFGDTPGKVRTRRGQHFLYRDTGASLGKLQSLKRCGLNADVKHGRSIVVAPPSRHEKERTFTYAWDGCDETVIGDLPVFNTRALQDLIDRAGPSPTRDLRKPVETPSPTRDSRDYVTSNCPRAGRAPRGGIAELVARYGSRGLALNAWLCRQVGACESLDALFDCARTFDAELIAAGLGSLEPDNELVKRTAAVWKNYQDGKIQAWAGARAVARTDAEEIKDLCAHSAKNGGDAFALLMLLRAEHGARMQRGETFALRTAAMEECGTLPGWTAERIVKARNVLLEANYLREVEAARNTRNGRLEAQYTLVPRSLSVFREAPDAAPTQDFRHGPAQPENLGEAQPGKPGMGSVQLENPDMGSGWIKLTDDDVRQFRVFLEDCATEALRRMRDGEGEAQPPLGIPVPARVLEEWTAEESVELETKALLQIKAILESEDLSAEEKRSRIEVEVNAVRTRNGA